MRLPDIYDQRTGPVISFEIFPPKTQAAEAKLREAVPRLQALRPAFVTCTCGAGGSTRERTLEIAAWIKHQVGLESVCHLTCLGAGLPELRATVGRIRQEGIENIVALRGDPPQESGPLPLPDDGPSHAIELVRLIRTEEVELGRRFGVGVAGYPETHPEAPSAEIDLRHLKEKVDAGGDVVLSQLFFDNQAFYRFRERARAVGIAVPVVPGLMPIQSAKQVRHITGLCGAAIPDHLEAQLSQAGDDPAAVTEIGTRHCLSQARDLLQNGVPGIHFFVLNHSRQMAAIMQGLGLA